MTQQVITLRASSVASAIGIGYTTPNELVNEMWARNSPLTFKGQTKDNIANRVINAHKPLQTIMQDAKEFKSDKSTDVSKELQKATQAIDKSNIPTADKIIAAEAVRKELYTRHGIRNEAKTADRDAKRLRTDDNYYSMDVCEIDDVLYKITGKIDRIQDNEDGSRTLVEIKNRTKRLFNCVRRYEEVQVQTYLQMLGLTTARLVEQYNDQTREYLIERDDDTWNENTLPKIIEFCEMYHDTVMQNVVPHLHPN